MNKKLKYVKPHICELMHCRYFIYLLQFLPARFICIICSLEMSKDQVFVFIAFAVFIAFRVLMNKGACVCPRFEPVKIFVSVTSASLSIQIAG
jgi:hypothetical protein